MSAEPAVGLSEPIGDSIKTTTCYMCACRCGIRVHLSNGKVRYIDGNRDHPINRGVICGKGAAGIMQHNSPARLRAPLKRVGPRGSGEFEEIGWDEALSIATGWLRDVRRSDPKRLAFFTGRDQSQSLTGYWAIQFGTPNYAAHGGFCSVNMAAAGLYTLGGAFWEFGEPDWEHTRYFMLFGVAEEHGSNPMKINLGKLKRRGAKFVSVNPVQTGYSAIADEWIGIRPGTDGLFVGALIHELLRTDRIDVEFLVRYTNAPWLVIDDKGAPDHGLFARGAGEGSAAAGPPLVFDQRSGGLADANRPDIAPAIVGAFKLADGRRAVPAFQLLAERYLAAEYSPDSVAAETGIAAADMRRIAGELAQAAFEQEIELDVAWTDWAGRRHDKIVGRPVSMHAMRGISAHSNGFQTCRAIHILQILLGTIDCPGGFRYKAPYPRETPPPLKPHGRLSGIRPDEPLAGPHLGFPLGPEDLLIDERGEASRIDKGFSWEAPLAAHGLMHMVISNAAAGDPYPVDVLFMYMANMGWNSSMNVPGTIRQLTEMDPATGDYKIPKIIYSDAYYSETVPYADLVLPDTTYLERWDCISLLDRPISEPDAPADAIRQPVVKPDRDVRPFQDVLIDLGARLGLPGFVDDAGGARYPGGYSDYMVNHQRKPGIGPLAGWRGKDGTAYGKGEPNPRQLERYIENGCFHIHELHENERYYRYANQDYLALAQRNDYRGSTAPIVLQLYVETMQRFRLAAEGHGRIVPPEQHRARIARYFDPLPFWYAPFEGTAIDGAKFPLYAVTQRPMHMYHSWGSQNAWLRQITNDNRLYMHPDRAAAIGVVDDDWVWISSHLGRVRCQVRLMRGVNPDTVWTWNAIGKRAGAWNLDEGAPESRRGFLLNHLIGELLPDRGGYRYSNSDPITGQAAWYDLRVSVEKAAAADSAEDTLPRFEPLPRVVGSMPAAPDVLEFGAEFRRAAR